MYVSPSPDDLVGGGHPTVANHQGAERACNKVAPGGHLASIRSPAEAKFINTHVIGEGAVPPQVWIGCNRSAVDGTSFQWIDDFSPARLDSGETLWGPGEPDNNSEPSNDLGREMVGLLFDHGQNCCMARSDEGLAWADWACHNMVPFVCKAPVEWVAYGGGYDS